MLLKQRAVSRGTLEMWQGIENTPTCSKIIDAACEHTINLFRNHMFKIFERVIEHATIEIHREMERTSSDRDNRVYKERSMDTARHTIRL